MEEILATCGFAGRCHAALKFKDPPSIRAKGVVVEIFMLTLWGRSGYILAKLGGKG